MRFLHRRDESLSGELLLTMATLFGAWALRPRRRPAASSPASRPTWPSSPCPTATSADPYNLLLESDLPVVGTVFEGDFVAGRWMGN